MADTEMAGFVEVVVEATGRREWVPADWVGHEVLGRGISLPPADDTVAPLDAGDALPTEASTHKQIDAFAAEHGVDLPSGTKAEKLAALAEAFPAEPAPAAVEASPDVDLVLATEGDGPLVPAARDTQEPPQDPPTDPAAGEEN